MLLASALGGSCAGQTNSGGTDSNTHWLRSCATDSDCGSLACVCGTCTRRCSDTTACRGLPGARCTPSSDCSDREASNVCEATCNADGDCSRLGADFRCNDGLCREPRAGDGGSGGIGGSDATSGRASGGGDALGSGAGGSRTVAGSGGSSVVAGAGGDVDCKVAMQVSNDGSACESAPRYYWTAGWCMPFRCETCIGADCDALYASAAACDAAHAACYETIGLTRECTVDSDCAIAVRGCCGTCGTIDETHLIGIRADEEETYTNDVCGLIPCPACVSVRDPNAYAVCDEGRCAVKTKPN